MEAKDTLDALNEDDRKTLINEYEQDYYTVDTLKFVKTGNDQIETAVKDLRIDVGPLGGINVEAYNDDHDSWDKFGSIHVDDDGARWMLDGNQIGEAKTLTVEA